MTIKELYKSIKNIDRNVRKKGIDYMIAYDSLDYSNGYSYNYEYSTEIEFANIIFRLIKYYRFFKKDNVDNFKNKLLDINLEFDKNIEDKLTINSVKHALLETEKLKLREVFEIQNDIFLSVYTFYMVFKKNTSAITAEEKTLLAKTIRIIFNNTFLLDILKLFEFITLDIVLVSGTNIEHMLRFFSVFEKVRNMYFNPYSEIRGFNLTGSSYFNSLKLADNKYFIKLFKDANKLFKNYPLLQSIIDIYNDLETVYCYLKFYQRINFKNLALRVNIELNLKDEIFDIIKAIDIEKVTNETIRDILVFIKLNPDIDEDTTTFVHKLLPLIMHHYITDLTLIWRYEENIIISFRNCLNKICSEYNKQRS